MRHDDEAPYDGLIDSFERSLRARNRSPKTIKAYGDTARQFAAYGAAHDHPAALTDVRRSHVEEFISDQLDRHSTSTAATRFRCIQQFFRYAQDEGEIERSPMKDMSPPRVSESPVPILTEDEVGRLLQVCDGPAFDARRDNAMIRLFLDSGVRLAEMAGLTADDINLDRGTARVTGKGDRARDVAFGAKTTVALDRYLRMRRRHARRTDPAMWLGPKGGLTDSGIAQMVERRGGEAQIEGMHTHRLRHTFAHRWLASGGTEGNLQALAGWQSTQMVARYGASARAERAIAAHHHLALGDHL